MDFQSDGQFQFQFITSGALRAIEIHYIALQQRGWKMEVPILGFCDGIYKILFAFWRTFKFEITQILVQAVVIHISRHVNIQEPVFIEVY